MACVCGHSLALDGLHPYNCLGMASDGMIAAVIVYMLARPFGHCLYADIVYML